MLSLREQKKRLRAGYNHRRCALSRLEWVRMSAAIRVRLEQSRLFQDAEVLLTYVSAKDNEVDTHALIDDALAAGKEVLVPVPAEKSGEIGWSQLHHLGDLVGVRFGLLEPAPDKVDLVQPPLQGLCIVPGIAFTRSGYRLGYGGGYYDRFLADFQGVSIGLAFEIQVTHSLPVEEHDYPVRYVLTESDWYERNKDTEPGL